jgi:hypothetical protein
MSWQIAAAANAVISVAFLAIAYTLGADLKHSRQLWRNRLGLATTAILAACGIGHLVRFGHLTAGILGGAAATQAPRIAVEPYLVVVDVVTAGIGIWYWSLRSLHPRLVPGAALFDDVQQRQQQALALNDGVVQGLAVIQYALENGQTDVAHRAAQDALAQSQRIMADLLGQSSELGHLAGQLVRTDPAAARPVSGQTTEGE